MCKWNQSRRLLLGVIFIWVTTAGAGMLTCEEIFVDFTNAGTAGQNAEWSGCVDLTKAGLGFDGKGTENRDGWVLTKPLAAGTAWRPAIRVSVDVKVSPAPQPF